MFRNILKIARSYIWVFGIIIGIAIIAIPTYYFMDSELIIWNLWYRFYVVEVSLTIITALLLWLFLWATFYKMNYFSIKDSSVWVFWWFLWAIVSWCPACSITLASYLGLAWFIYLLPYSWLELKAASILILVYANYSVLRDLESCKIKKIF